MSRLLTFERLRALSFSHSAIYAGLLYLALTPGKEDATAWFGWAHGLLWIGISLLCLEAVRRRVLPLWLAVVVVVVGGLGPSFGTLGFLVAKRSGSPHAAAG